MGRIQVLVSIQEVDVVVDIVVARKDGVTGPVLEEKGRLEGIGAANPPLEGLAGLGPEGPPVTGQLHVVVALHPLRIVAADEIGGRLVLQRPEGIGEFRLADIREVDGQFTPDIEGSLPVVHGADVDRKFLFLRPGVEDSG